MHTGVPDSRSPQLAETLKRFNSNLEMRRASVVTSYAHQLFAPHTAREIDTKVPPKAWLDEVDALLSSLAKRTFAPLFGSTMRRADSQPQPLAGAVARYEPVFGKVPHYYFPSEKRWDALVTDRSLQIARHMQRLQEEALRGGVFAKLPKASGPTRGDGLIPLLEHLAVYPSSAKTWAKHRDLVGVNSEERALFVGDLNKCPFVSGRGQRHYVPRRGCLLLPFVAHDNRLVGHGLIVFDEEIDLADRELRRSLAREWRALFDVTISPLMANLNSAALSGLDAFFLGRLQRLRHVLGTPASPARLRRKQWEKGALLPERDLLVLNKIAIYELIEERGARTKADFYVAFFDLDGFKGINDAVGHQAADLLLFHIAKMLTDPQNGVFSPKRQRWLGRFGGDEFVGVFFEGKVNVGRISKHIALCIRRAVRTFNREQVNKIPPQTVTASIGWVRRSDFESITNATGLNEDRRRQLTDMDLSHALIELADSETQDCVKDLGKNGYLEFASRKGYRKEKKAMTMELPVWLKMVGWFEQPRPREPKVKLEF